MGGRRATPRRHGGERSSPGSDEQGAGGHIEGRTCRGRAAAPRGRNATGWIGHRHRRNEVEHRRREFVIATGHDHTEGPGHLPVTTARDLHHAVGPGLLRAIGDLDSGVAAEEPGPAHGRAGRERDEGNGGDGPAQHVARLTARVPTGKEAQRIRARPRTVPTGVWAPLRRRAICARVWSPAAASSSGRAPAARSSSGYTPVNFTYACGSLHCPSS
jgi:hypothetical protein